MHKVVAFIAFVISVPAVALAQHHSGQHQAETDHSSHSLHRMHAGQADQESPLTEGGQSAFAAIQEIVQVLERDPSTDWSKVNVERLRTHLRDMDDVVLSSAVGATNIPAGARFEVVGEDRTRGAIQRMVSGHAATVNGERGWFYRSVETRDGASLVVTGRSDKDAAKIRGLGFIGIMTLGDHHQSHHLAMARGDGVH